MIKPELEQSIVSIDDVISLDDNEDPASADEMEDSASVSGVSAGIYLSSTCVCTVRVMDLLDETLS